MTTSALLAAAGSPDIRSTGNPFDQIGSITAIERIIATLRKAGIHRILVVTGYKSEELERLLASSHIIFIQNKNFKDTDMLSSIKLGLAYLKGKTDRLLFTPADVPLFTCGTVQELLTSDAPITIPVCQDKTGHPILLSADLIDPILSFEADGGLRAFLQQREDEIRYIAVQDQGILLQSSTDISSNYNELLEMHNKDLVRPKLSIGLVREKIFFDEQVFNLLVLIDETGNVREACKHIHISYTTSWNLIQRLENELQCQLVSRAQGGSRGSHSELTPFGKQFLVRYNEYTNAVRSYASELFDRYFDNLF